VIGVAVLLNLHPLGRKGRGIIFVKLKIPGMLKQVNIIVKTNLIPSFQGQTYHPTKGVDQLLSSSKPKFLGQLEEETFLKMIVF
jgi:hypothetical protein